VMPRRGGRVLGVLADLVDSGTEVVCFGGNHDWWVGRSLVEEYGITVRHEPLWLEAQGLRLYVRHGDGYSQPSRRYDFARFVLHHPVAIGLFRWLHPDVAGRLADYVACRPSRQALNWQPKRHLYPVYERLSAEVFAAGADVAVFGHVHTSRLKATPDGTMVVLGDWKSQASYGELRDGRFRLAMWRDPDQPLWP